MNATIAFSVLTILALIGYLFHRKKFEDVDFAHDQNLRDPHLMALYDRHAKINGALLFIFCALLTCTFISANPGGGGLSGLGRFSGL